MNTTMKVFRDSVRTLYKYQKMRIALNNIIKSGNYAKFERNIIKEQFEKFEELEKELADYVTDCVKYTSLWKDYLKDVKGVGPILAGVILSEFDIEKATNVSKMWSFAGLGGPNQRLIKGQKLKYNAWLRSKLCGPLAKSFLVHNENYRELYYNYKNRITNEPAHSGKSKLHIHRMAVRYMIKMFLKDLYVNWRQIEGLPVTETYAEKYLSVKHHDEAKYLK